MNSSPPSARDSVPPALPRLAEAGFRAHALDESVIFFCVDDAPREACRTESLPHGGLAFRTTLAGRIERAGGEEMVLALEGGRRTRVRYLIPSALDLGSLVGHLVSLEIVQQYAGPGRATVDARLCDAAGRLIFWARDGRMPEDKVSLGLALRTSLDARGARRLAVAHAGGVTSIGVPDLARLRTADGTFELAVVRLGAEDVSFVLVRR